MDLQEQSESPLHCHGGQRLRCAAKRIIDYHVDANLFLAEAAMTWVGLGVLNGMLGPTDPLLAQDWCPT